MAVARAGAVISIGCKGCETPAIARLHLLSGGWLSADTTQLGAGGLRDAAAMVNTDIVAPLEIQ